MKIYHFNKETGEYLNTTDARKDPLGKGFMVPANATKTAPPPTQQKECPCFEDNKWIIKKDLRGDLVYKTTDGEEIKIDYLGDIKPEHAATPRPDLDHVYTNGKWVVDLKLQKEHGNDLANGNIAEIDFKSIGFIRKYIVSQPKPPAELVGLEALAEQERNKIKP